MRRLLKFILFILLILSLLACSDDSNSNDKNYSNLKNEKAINYAETGWVPQILSVEEEDDITPSDEKFSKFWEIKDVTDGYVSSFAVGYDELNYNGKYEIKRKQLKGGYIEYIFTQDDIVLFNVKNKSIIYGPKSEYIQFGDINADGKDEILISYFTHNAYYYVCYEFYVYSLVGQEWQEIFAYNSNEGEGNIVELLCNSEYKDKSIVDVNLQDNGLVISLEDGYQEEGTWYSKGYRILVN